MGRFVVKSGGWRGLNVLPIAGDRGERITNHDRLIFNDHWGSRQSPAVTST